MTTIQRAGPSLPGDAVVRTYEPAHPDRLVGEVPMLDDQALEDAVLTAASAKGQWAVAALARAHALEGWALALERERDAMVEIIVREVGKPAREAAGEVARGIAILRYYAQAALDPIGEVLPTAERFSRLEVERRPLGTVLIVTPWNFPVAIPIWKMAPALAYGNTVLFRPSSAAVATARLLIDLAHKSVPRESLRLLPCTTEKVERLLADSRIAGVSFTGSARVGSSIVRTVSARGGHVQAEMGGQNASIVLGDADLALAAEVIADASMAYAGQKCTATSRIIVERRVADRFVADLTERVRGLSIGEPSLAETAVGPMISQAARAEVQRAVRDAVDRGARVLTGGESLEREGWFYQPALLSVDDLDDPFLLEETFGPAAAVIVADSPEEALEIANATRYGLSGAVFGSDIDRAARLARQLNAGLIRVNASTTGVDYHAPFGGEGASSYGPKEQGKAARDFYTTTRTLLIRSFP